MVLLALPHGGGSDRTPKSPASSNSRSLRVAKEYVLGIEAAGHSWKTREEEGREKGKKESRRRKKVVMMKEKEKRKWKKKKKRKE